MVICKKTKLRNVQNAHVKQSRLMINLTDEVIARLEKKGCRIMCESPLEIELENMDAIATNYAAEIIIEQLLAENDED